jgi:hypothetical protein
VNRKADQRGSKPTAAGMVVRDRRPDHLGRLGRVLRLHLHQAQGIDPADAGVHRGQHDVVAGVVRRLGCLRSVQPSPGSDPRLPLATNESQQAVGCHSGVRMVLRPGLLPGALGLPEGAHPLLSPGEVVADHSPSATGTSSSSRPGSPSASTVASSRAHR